MNIIKCAFSLILLIQSSSDCLVSRSNYDICNFTENAEATSAFKRAKTSDCKNEIENVACEINKQNDLIAKGDFINGFYRLSLNRLCPESNNNLVTPESASVARLESKFFSGCVYKDNLYSHLEDLKRISLAKEKINSEENYSKFNPPLKINASTIHTNIKILQLCIDICLSDNQFKYSLFNEELKECICLKKFNDNLTSKMLNKQECKKVGEDKKSETFEIYDTGLLSIRPLKIKLDTTNRQNEIQTAKIVFLLTINGRSIRQIFRLIKAIYHEQHFYYFHVDKRMGFLRKEIEKIINIINSNNFYIAEWSFPSIWGGSTLLKVHLNAMKDILEFKKSKLWNWDFVLNLSETDFPIKTVNDLTFFLSQHKDKNFVKFFSSNFENFARNQALDSTFLQCENRMWRIGKRKYPLGIQLGGGSDWFCLNYNFVNYVINSNDEFIEHLKVYFNYTLLPSETFFHTLILNSKFCHSYINTHLRLVNWKRERGCNCQHKNVVDWCGCSPNHLTLDDLKTIQELKEKPIFFARKFDPLFNNQLINAVDQSMFGLYSANFKSLNSYWHNMFHHEDTHIELKFKILYDYFIKASIQEFLKKFNSLANHFDSIIDFNKINIFLNSLIQKKINFKILKTVDAYFESNSFKGFVLNFQIHDENFVSTFEAYFTKTKISEFINLIQPNETSNKNENFLKNLVQIKISSDYDSKERKFSNYANIIDQNSNPTILMEFDPIEPSLEFKINWYDSENILVKETSVNLNESSNNQIILNSFFKAKEPIKVLKSYGVWKIEIVQDQISILSLKFLVLPANNSKSNEEMFELYEKLQYFWNFNSLCVDTFESSELKNNFLFNELFQNCQKSAHWSTYYPDPKSDLKLSLFVDSKNRIL